jgi:segregation and condensation protein B
MSKAAKATKVESDTELESLPPDEIEGHREIGDAELKAIAEAMIFVADEPVSAKTIAEVIKVGRETIDKVLVDLVAEYDARNSGLQLREIAAGWQIATRTEHHEQIRAYLK